MIINLVQVETKEQREAGYWFSEISYFWYQQVFKDKAKAFYNYVQVKDEDELFYLNNGDVPPQENFEE